MTAFRTARVATALLAGVVLAGLGPALAGCGVVDPTAVTHHTPAPAALQDRVDCAAPSEWRPDYGPTDPPAQLMGGVPAGFVPVDVVHCVLPLVDSQPVAEQHLSGGYGPLLAALALPSDRADSRSCLDWAEGPLQLWLVNADGKAVHVMWPLDVCGKSKPATNEALAALHVTRTTAIEQVQPSTTEPAPSIPAAP